MPSPHTAWVITRPGRAAASHAASTEYAGSRFSASCLSACGRERQGRGGRGQRRGKESLLEARLQFRSQTRLLIVVRGGEFGSEDSDATDTHAMVRERKGRTVSTSALGNVGSMRLRATTRRPTRILCGKSHRFDTPW